MKVPGLVLCCALGVLGGCVSHEPMETVDYVDVDRFMGDWYVIACIPTWIEKDAYNEVESYERVGEKKIATTLTFNKGSFDGPEKRYTPTGFVHNEETGAEWRMQFVWPFKAEYLIIYLDDDYQTTVVGRTKRDYVWIMSRTPTIDDEQYASLVRFVEGRGYDVSDLRKVPQQER